MALDHCAIFCANFVAATERHSFLDAHLVPDEVTPYRRQYHLLHEAYYEFNMDKMRIREAVEVHLQLRSAPKIAWWPRPLDTQDSSARCIATPLSFRCIGALFNNAQFVSVAHV